MNNITGQISNLINQLENNYLEEIKINQIKLADALKDNHHLKFKVKELKEKLKDQSRKSKERLIKKNNKIKEQKEKIQKLKKQVSFYKTKYLINIGVIKGK